MKKGIFITLISAIMAFSIALSAQAQSKDVAVMLNLISLKSLEITERGYDQIYLTTQIIAANQPQRLLRIPEYPLHWIIKKNQNILGQKIWEGVLKDGDTVQIIISLIEQDLFVFETDDLIGTAKVTLINNNGELKANWRIPNTGQVPPSINTPYGPAYVFDLRDEKSAGHYIMQLGIHSMPLNHKENPNVERLQQHRTRILGP